MKTANPGKRLHSLDILRGLVMVIMALDHTRHFLVNSRLDEFNVSNDLAWLFITRWITHFCAPVFLFLAGVSVKLMENRENNLKTTSIFLIKRGFWLIFLELVVMNVFWDSNIFSVELQILWIFGVTFLLMSLLIHVPGKVNFLVAVTVIVFHNFLDKYHLNNGFSDFLMNFFNSPGTFEPGNFLHVLVLYTVIPWSAVLLLGYSMAGIYDMDSPKRKRILLISGISMIIAFFILRSTNIYGDGYQWSIQSRGTLFSIMSFLNVTKYPASLHFILLTLGPSFILLALLDTISETRLVKLRILGQVALFFYIIHIPVIRAFSKLSHILFGKDIGALYCYGIWIFFVILLYRLSKMYLEFKQVRKNDKKFRWLKYL